MMPIRVRISQHSSLVLTPRAAQERGRGPEEGASRGAEREAPGQGCCTGQQWPLGLAGFFLFFPSWDKTAFVCFSEAASSFFRIILSLQPCLVLAP